MKVTDLDVDQDGIIDRLFRVSWSISNHPSEALYVRALLDPKEPIGVDKESISRILTSAKRIDFSETAPNISRLKVRYDARWTQWAIFGQVYIDGLQLADGAYFIAWHYGISKERLAQAYVFQIGRDGEPIDVCMFARVCPCSGCVGNVDDMYEKLVPSNKYCMKNYDTVMRMQT